MVDEGYDLVIRVNPAPDESLVGRIFLRDRLVVVAPTGQSTLAIETVLRLSSHFMVRDAVRLGVGAARLPLSLVSDDLAAGTLVAWGDVDGPDVALWVLYPSRRLLSARVSAFLGYLREAFPNGTPDELASFMSGD